jgi:hypothetical protein
MGLISFRKGQPMRKSSDQEGPHMPQRVALLILVVGTAATAHTQEKPGYPVCRAGSALLVGEVPDNPFMARVAEDAWESAPDGSRKRIDAPKKESAYSIARDGKGRVIIQTKSDGKLTAVSGEGIVTSYTDYICDPAANTATRIHYQDVFIRAVDHAGQDFYSQIGKAGQAFVQTQTDPRTTTTFRAYHKRMEAREEVGPEVFEGVPAFRYRFLKTPQHDPAVHELVISEDLEAFLAQIAWDEDRTYLREVRLTKIYREEPPPFLMQPPQGVMLNWQTIPAPKTSLRDQAPPKE